MKNYSKAIWNQIRQHLQEHHIEAVTEDREDGQFRFPMYIGGAIRKIDCIIGVGEDDFVVMGISPLGADVSIKGMGRKMCEFFCRANFGLKNGNFEFDFRDGEIRYKCYVDCEDSRPSDGMIRNSILCPAAMFRRYAPGMVDVMFHNAEPEQAVRACERSSGLGSLMKDVFAGLRDRLSGQGKHHSGDEGAAEEAPVSFEEFMKMMDWDEEEDSVVDEADADQAV